MTRIPKWSTSVTHVIARWAGSLWEVSGPVPYWRYRLIRRQVPIACVDVMPVRLQSGLYEVGFIKRVDENGEVKWAMIGGGVYRNETVIDAMRRHVQESLGPDAHIQAPCEEQPHAAGQYFPKPRRGYGTDPRKHSIALSYWTFFEGTPAVTGREAEDFDWFAIEAIPRDEEFGYGHGPIAHRVVIALIDWISEDGRSR
jgi:ADP-ribose pyrophosphatase YjhB (NUDIX family)